MKTRHYYSKNGAVLAKRIDQYFTHIQGEYHTEQKPVKAGAAELVSCKVWDREPEPATIAGMALFLGFTSKQDFETYELNGEYAGILKQGRLRVEAAYESRLYQTSTGVIFALKTMGWTDKPEEHKLISPTDRTLKIQIINSGPSPAGNEKDVVL